MSDVTASVGQECRCGILVSVGSVSLTRLQCRCWSGLHSFQGWTGALWVCCVWCEPASKFTNVGLAGEIRSLPLSVKQLTTGQMDGSPQLEWAKAEADIPESHFFCNIVFIKGVVQWSLHVRGGVHGVTTRRRRALWAPHRLPVLTCEHKPGVLLINTPHYCNSRLNSSNCIGLFFWAYCLVGAKVKNKIYLGDKRRRKGITTTLNPPCVNTCIFAFSS